MTAEEGRPEEGRTVAGILSLSPVVPVLVFRDADHAVPAARALLRGGLRVLEVTLRTPAALEALRRIAAEVPEAVVGAGTVLRASQLDEAKAAGAGFCVSPGFTPELLAAARGAGMPLLPGASTPAECMMLLDQGYRHLKFFPAEASGGIALLKALASPLAEVTFCPTGGIDLARARDYLALPNVACIGGSWLTPADALEAGDWGRIETLAREAAALAR
jgi:2-dehydro-3-deoxyphosphogluconate aldolase / (4S)-4-hydroxy-2-oxoglutarate aldolase